MKRMIVALLALALVFSFVSCDAMLNVMDKMGNNVAGTEKKVIEDSLNAAKPNPSTIVDNGDGSKSFTQGEGDDAKTLFTVKEGEDKTTLEFGDVKIDLKAGALKDVESVLTPTDLSSVLNGLKSGSKSEIEAELKKPADEESKKAAEGTQAVIDALVSDILPERKSVSETMTEEEKKEAEAINTALDTLDTILGKGSEEKEMTQADVVVLTAITNAVFNEDVMDSMQKLQKEEKEEMTQEEKEALKKEQEEAQKKLTEALANEVATMADVVSVVPSDMASGILDVLNLLTSSSK
ncbi:MAG: hypothetical protein ACI4SL_06835 [Candidatus Ornithospirochaeta sp.]